MKLSYYGHSCFLLETGGKRILFDPFITPNPLAGSIEVDAIQCDYILVSHGHGDHTADLVSIAARTGATVVANFEITEWCARQGIEKVHPMNTGGSWTFDFGRVTNTYAAHSSSFADGSYAGLAGGFIVSNSEATLYYAGDTALTQDMKLLCQRHSIDYALLPIGDNFTMGVEDAVIAAQFINCRNIVGMHYDTFPYVAIDKDEARRKFAAQDTSLLLMDIGQSVELGSELFKPDTGNPSEGCAGCP